MATVIVIYAVYVMYITTWTPFGKKDFMPYMELPKDCGKLINGCGGNHAKQVASRPQIRVLC